MRPTARIVLTLALIASGAPASGEGPDPQAATQAAALVQRLAAATLDSVWADALLLEGLGAPAVPALKEALAAPQEPLRLAAAKALCVLGEKEAACPVLTEAARTASPQGRLTALRILGEYGGVAAVKPLLALLDDEALARRERLGAASALWRRSQNMKAVQLCRDALQDPDAAIRHAAVLALGEMGQMTEARQPLEELALCPTDDGERARAILLADRLAQTLAAQERPDVKEGQEVLAEIAGMIQRYYVDEAKCDVEDLFEAAAKGLAASLDPHSSYMGRKDVKAMDERMDGHYAGVGAVVSKENGVLTIVSTFFEGPAYKAGIRAGDIITKIEGQTAVDFDLEEAVHRMKGEPGTEVSLEIVRRGVVKPIPFRLKRAVINVRSTLHEMLPGQVGYIRLTQFGKQSGAEVRAAVESLQKDGAKALILDLRDNGGGLLSAAVEIGDLFLKSNQLVVYSEGRSPEVAPREDYYAGGRYDREGRWINPPRAAAGKPAPCTLPMAVLIDRGSASASEIVSGALKDHARAVLVGEKSFGKGSVQQLRHLESTGRQTVLRITVAKYYLPSGHCIHGVGVEPDVAILPPDLVGWKFEEYRRLVDADVFVKYFDEHPVKGDAAMAALATDDGNSWERYPGFGPWYEGLKTPLSKDDVRLFLRRWLRERVAEDRGRAFETDLADDVQLRRGVLEVLKRAGIDPKSVAAYAKLDEEFSKGTP